MADLSSKPGIEENSNEDLLQVCRLSYSNPCFVLGSFSDESSAEVPDVKDVQYIHQTLCMDWKKQMIGRRRAIPKSLKATKKYLKEIMTTTYTGALVDKPLKEYITGSSYEGTYDQLGFSGVGTYYFPHGAIYEGQFSNGEFHGSGTLFYPGGQQLEGTWRKGKLKNWVYKFSDGLHYSKSWNYLALPDRAYQIELRRGFKAPGAEYITSKKIEFKRPPGCYDVGNQEFYDHTKRLIFSKDGKMRRIVNEEEISMIRKNFLQESDEPVGYHPEYYEYWCTGRSDEIRKINHMFIDKRKFNKPTFKTTTSYFSKIQ